MNLKKEFDSLIIPLIKGLPITIVLLAIAIFVTRRTIHYATYSYQANGAIKIDNRDFNLPAFNINDKSAVVPTSSSNLMTELEIFKSKKLLKACFEQLDFTVSYYRVGKVKTVEIYDQSPFTITATVTDQSLYGKLLYLEYLGDDKFAFRSSNDINAPSEVIQFHRTWRDKNISITIQKNIKLLAAKKNVLQTGDLFAFKVNTIDGLVSNIGEENLFIKAVDKDVSIIKIYYTDEVPTKAQAFTNALMQTYIDESNKSISNQSQQALSFVNEQLKTTAGQLKFAEGKLAAYKTQNGIINSKQETDASLKEIVQLDIQRVGYEMKENELKRLYDFLASGQSLQDFSPNFEALDDPIFRENYLKVQNYEAQKKDLLIKFTEQSEEVMTIVEKINNTRSFLNASVNNTLKNIESNKNSLANAMNSINLSIQDYPDKEREVTVLEREVKLKEQLYTYLAEKKAELSISNSAKRSFHKIIDHAKVPTNHIWPNKPLAYGLAIFLALLIGFLISFILHFFFASIKDKETLASLTEYPILSTVSKIKNQDQIATAYGSLHTNLEVLKKEPAFATNSPIVSITSLQGKEGKTLTAVNLASSIATSGKKVLLIDMDIRKPNIHMALGMDNHTGLSDLIQKKCEAKDAIQASEINNLDVLTAGDLTSIFPAIVYGDQTTNILKSFQHEYDIIIIDTPPIRQVVETIPLFHQSTINLLLLKASYSKVRTVKQLDAYLEDFKIPNLHLVLNNVKGSTTKYKANKTKQVNFKFTFNQIT